VSSLGLGKTITVGMICRLYTFLIDFRSRVFV